MPANLPPHYLETEKKLKTAATAEEKIAIYEELLSIIPKHKGTEKLQAQLKTKIAKCKSAAQKKSSTARHGASYKVEKSGAGQVVLVGPPNAGKSRLVKSLTNAEPQVGDYPFTTLTTYPAMMPFENIQVQLVDAPPISPDYMEPWFPDLIRTADCCLIVIDSADPDALDMLQFIQDKLGGKKIRLVGEGREPAGEHGWCSKRSLVVGNKIDLTEAVENLEVLREFIEPDLLLVPASAGSGEGLEDLKKRIFTMLEVIRVYSKIPGKKAELNDPFTLKKGSTVMDMARAVHKDFSQKLRFARIWSENKYDGQRVNRHHVLEDEDIIELNL
jgi:hypothetical protein